MQTHKYIEWAGTVWLNGLKGWMVHSNTVEISWRGCWSNSQHGNIPLTPRENGLVRFPNWHVELETDILLPGQEEEKWILNSFKAGSKKMIVRLRPLRFSTCTNINSEKKYCHCIGNQQIRTIASAILDCPFHLTIVPSLFHEKHQREKCINEGKSAPFVWHDLSAVLTEGQFHNCRDWRVELDMVENKARLQIPGKLLLIFKPPLSLQQ